MKHIACAVALVVSLILTAGLSETGPASAAGPPRSSTSCGHKVYKASGEPWRCIFADEFSSSSLDGRKWVALTTAQTDLRGNGDCWVNSPNNIAIAGGALRLTSRKEDAPITCTLRSGETYQAEYTSGSVSTSGRFSQAFGRWDVRARFPQATTPGSQAALWLYPNQLTYGAWPRSGEIDIGEFYSSYPDRVIPYIHYSMSSPDSTVTNNYCYVDKPTDFHVYSAVWVPGRITISIDGTICVDHAIHPAAPLTGSQPFDKPFFLNLTQSLGAGSNSVNADTPTSLTTEVDWVHVWW